VIYLKQKEGNIMEDNKSIVSILNKGLDNNLSKGEILEYATLEALERLQLSYNDFTEIYNFHSPYNKHVPDYIAKNYVIECKNWNCLKYFVTPNKGYTEIFKRFSNFLHLNKILIISNPKWIKRVKIWLLSLGVKILELGYFVTWDNVDRAINDIVSFFKILFGYVNTSYVNTSYSLNTSYSRTRYVNTINLNKYKLGKLMNDGGEYMKMNIEKWLEGNKTIPLKNLHIEIGYEVTLANIYETIFSLNNLISTLISQNKPSNSLIITHGYKGYYDKLRYINKVLKEGYL